MRVSHWPGGSYGLVHLDGHSDFRHPGNSNQCRNLAGEDLAAAIGQHWPAVADIDGQSPYFNAERVAHIGCRNEDEHLAEIRGTLGAAVTVDQVRARGPEACAELAGRVAGSPSGSGYWLHLDVDILDPSYLPTVDSPADGGITPAELSELLAALAPGAVGMQVTVFDPDQDHDQRCARLLTDILDTGIRELGSGSGSAPARPM